MKRVSVILTVILIGLFLGGLWWKFSLTPANSKDNRPKPFVINKGDGIREIALKLHDQGLIRDQIAFFLLVKKLGLEKNIQAGSFQLSPSLTAQQLAQKLTVGTEDVWVTIPEGWRNEEISEYLEKNNFSWENQKATMGLRQMRILEEKLFPETYLVPKQATIDSIIELMNRTFEQKLDSKIRQQIESSGFTIDEIVTIASLIEREARTQGDRPIVASVIYNRLKSEMSLDIDASVQYAIGRTEKEGWWKKNLTIEDLKIKSPYNTYINPGLPPTPICNPGMSAINAALFPSQTDYYFYLSDKQGRMHYAKTLEEHNKNVAKFIEN